MAGLSFVPEIWRLQFLYKHNRDGGKSFPLPVIGNGVIGPAGNRGSQLNGIRCFKAG